MKARIEKLIKALSDGLFEREETVAVTLLAALSGQSVFLYGLPGTAKSLIARRIASAFTGAKHFEYLMQRFSTPEEVFGPISIHELKNDNYIRKTEGYLPTADVAFLDEIWKSSPAILNTLLTIINERVFRNGMAETKVPLKALIAASNETPPANQGLEALYDRFVVRLLVSPMSERANFEKLLKNAQTAAHAENPEALAFTGEEWEQHLKAIDQVELSGEVLNVIHAIKCAIKEYNENNPDKAVYVSDRRWLKIACLLKAAAHFCGRQEVIVVDTLLCRHCLWTQESSRADIAKIVENCIPQSGHPNKAELEAWEQKYKDLEMQITDVFSIANVHESENINGEKCIPFTIQLKSREINAQPAQLKFYAPYKHMKGMHPFTPINEKGEKEDRVRCEFNKNILVIKKDESAICIEDWDCQRPTKVYKEYDRKVLVGCIKTTTIRTITPPIKDVYQKLAESAHREIMELYGLAQNFYLEQQQSNYTPFIPDEVRKLVIHSLGSHIKDLENHCLNAERLLESVCKHANHC